MWSSSLPKSLLRQARSVGLSSAGVARRVGASTPAEADGGRCLLLIFRLDLHRAMAIGTAMSAVKRLSLQGAKEAVWAWVWLPVLRILPSRTASSSMSFLR